MDAGAINMPFESRRGNKPDDGAFCPTHEQIAELCIELRKLRDLPHRRRGQPKRLEIPEFSSHKVGNQTIFRSEG